MSKVSQYRDSSYSELESMLEEARRDLFNLNNDSNLSKDMKSLNKISIKKKEIARLLTIMREKELAEELRKLTGEVA